MPEGSELQPRYIGKEADVPVSPAQFDTVVKQQEHQEGRLSTLEAEVRHVTEAVGQLAGSMETGFRETRELMQENNVRIDRRNSEIYERLDKLSERGRWNPTLTLAAITCALLIGGVFVSYVNLSLVPLAKDDAETRKQVEDHIKLGGHPEVMAQAARFEEEISDTKYEIEKLHAVTDKLIEKYADHARETGEMGATLVILKSEQDRRWSEFMASAETRGRLSQTVETLSRTVDRLSGRLPAANHNNGGEQ